jgi:HSP20 family protein
MPPTPIEVKKSTGQPEALPNLWHSFRSEVDNLFHRFDNGFGFPAMRRLIDIEPWFGRESFGAVLPAIDITEDDKAFKIAAELPGMDEKNVSVTVDGAYLVLKGEKSQETKKDDKSFHLSERSYGAFERSFRIPDSVDGAKIDAQFSKGVLTITLPKSPEAGAGAARKIEVKAA